MEWMKREHPDCRFYVFTNDKQWVKEKILQVSSEKDDKTGGTKETDEKPYYDIEVVDLTEQSDYTEFVLMSKCRHNILANSSFSWWASYLNRNTDKIVLVPDRWLNGWDCEDIYRKDMRKVQTGHSS